MMSITSPLSKGNVAIEICWLKVRSSLMVVTVLFIDLNLLASLNGIPAPVTAEARHLVLSPPSSSSSLSRDLF